MKRRLLFILVVFGVLVGLAVWWLADLAVEPAPPVPVAKAEEPDLRLVDGESVDAGVGRVSGIVLKSDETPAAGAMVRLYATRPSFLALDCGVCGLHAVDCEDPSTVRQLIAGIEANTIQPPVLVAETTADAKGEFTFDHAPLGGAVLAQLGRASAVAETDAELEMTLEDSQAQVISTVDGEGHALSGVKVSLYSPYAGTLSFRTSDAEGQVSLESLDPVAWVFAQAPGVFPAAGMLSDTEELRLTLPRTLVVHTMVGGKPVDAEVSIDLHGPAKKWKTTRGELRLEGLRQNDRSYVVAVTSGDLSAAEQTTELLEPITELTFDLRKTARLLVTVVGPTGEPLDEVNGTISGVDGDSRGTAERGALLILGPVPEGEYQLTVSSDHRATVTKPIDLPAGETSLEVTLRESPLVEGTVVAADGRPAIAARVAVFEGDQEIAVGLTNDEGTFSVEVQYSGSFEVRVESNVDGVAKGRALVPGPPLVLRLSMLGVIELEVFDFDGSPIEPDAEVLSLDDGAVRWLEQVAYSPGQNDFVGEGVKPAPGRSRLAGLPPGRYEVKKDVPERVPWSAMVDVAEGKVARLTAKLSKGVSVSGTVVNASGAPVAEATVSVVGQERAVASDAAGHFELIGLSVGTLELFAQGDAADGRPSGQSERVKVTAPATGVVIKLPAPIVVRGRVVDGGGVLIRSFEVNGRRFDSPDGRFEVQVPERSLNVWAEGYKPRFIAQAEVDLGDVVLLSIPVAEGEVLSADGKPVAGASVMGSIDSAQVATDAEGHFKLSVESDQPQDIIATRGAQFARSKLTLGQRLVLTLRRGTTVTGRVVGPGGQPTRSVVMAVSYANPRPLEVETDESGQFALEIEPGLWMFSTRANRAARTIEVKGERVELTLGEATGTCGGTVRSSKPIEGLWLLAAPAVAENGPWEQVGAVPGSITVPINQPAREVPLRGIPCAKYLLAASIENLVTSMPVQLTEGSQVFDVTPPSAAPAPPP